MPIPPALANDLEYSSLRKERHTPAPLLPPPNGPSPSIAVNIWLNIELRKTASKSTAFARALAWISVAVLPPAAVVMGRVGLAGGRVRAAAAITSPRCRLEWRRRL